MNLYLIAAVSDRGYFLNLGHIPKCSPRAAATPRFSALISPLCLWVTRLFCGAEANLPYPVPVPARQYCLTAAALISCFSQAWRAVTRKVRSNPNGILSGNFSLAPAEITSRKEGNTAKEPGSRLLTPRPWRLSKHKRFLINWKLEWQRHAYPERLAQSLFFDFTGTNSPAEDCFSTLARRTQR